MATDDLKPRSIKIGETTWRRWQAEAKARGIGVTALIIERMDGGEGSFSAVKARDVFMGKPTKTAKKKATNGDETKPGPLREDVPGYRLTRSPPHDLKPVASILPVTGTVFPGRAVYQRGQDPTKAKGKR